MNDSACSLEQSRFLSIQFLYCLAKTSVLLVLNPHFACANLQFGWFNPQVLMASPSAPSLRGGNEVDGPVGAGQMVNRTMEVQWFRTCLGLKIGYQYVPVPWVPHSIHWSILIPCCFPAIKRGNGKSAPTARNWGASWVAANALTTKARTVAEDWIDEKWRGWNICNSWEGMRNVHSFFMYMYWSILI